MNFLNVEISANCYSNLILNWYFGFSCGKVCLHYFFNSILPIFSVFLLELLLVRHWIMYIGYLIFFSPLISILLYFCSTFWFSPLYLPIILLKFFMSSTSESSFMLHVFFITYCFSFLNMSPTSICRHLSSQAFHFLQRKTLHSPIFEWVEECVEDLSGSLTDRR